MAELNFETGVKTFCVNGGAELKFNPTDSNFIKKVYDVFEELDRSQDEYTKSVSKLEGAEEIFTFAKSKDEEMRTMIDGIFGLPVCDSIFGFINVYAIADGFPVWANFLLAVMDAIDKQVGKEKETVSPKLEKLRKKYGQKK